MKHKLTKCCSKCGETKLQAENFTLTRTEGGRVYKDVCNACNAASVPMKVCSSCQKVKPVTEFFRRDGGGSLRGDCKVCSNMRKQRYRAKSAEPAPVTDVAANAFHWKVFVQPVVREVYNPMRESNRHGEMRG